MAERVGRKSIWNTLSRFEQITLVSTVLIWAGVFLFGAGLYVAIRNRGMERAAYAQATSIASTPYPTSTTPASTASPTAQPPTPTRTPTITPSPTPILYPAGWSTATPTPRVPHSPTADRPAATPTSTSVAQAAAGSSAASAPASSTLSEPSTPGRERAVPTPSTPPERLVIPAIDLDSPVIPVGWSTVNENGIRYSVWEVADRVVGWHRTSAYPGQADNVVLNGHHNIQGEVFRYLVDLEVGDHVLVYAGERVYHYAVSEKHILKERGEPAEVRKQNAVWIAPTGDERLTMVTCWPYTNNTHRLVVVARPIAPPPAGVLAP